MIGIVVMMLVVGILIIAGMVFFPNVKENEPISKVNLDYVDRFFDKNEVIDIYVTLERSDYEDMMENPLQEEYKIADIIIDGEKIDNVGFRVKGNSSLNMVAKSDSIRFSFKVDFGQYISGQNLTGLTKLNLNNSMNDPSYMREYLSYSLLNEMNIPTPGYCYTNLYINGELKGLYLAVEGIEGPFLERYYGSNYGTLYKPEGAGSDLVYIDDQINSYSGISLVTEPKNGSDSALLAMLKALNEGKDLEKYLNVDEILRYFAVNTVLVNLDSYQGNLKHNYYLYEEDGVFSILPWDYNMSFGGFNKTGQSPIALYIDQPVSGVLLEERPLIAKLLEIEEYKDLYRQYIEGFITDIFTVKKMNEEIERIATMIRPYLEEDPTKFYTMEQFEQAITAGTSERNLSTNVSKGMKVDGFSQAKDKSIDQTGLSIRKAPSEATDIAQVPPDNRIKMERQRGANGQKLDNENVIGLVDFISERIDNVAKQLSGELPSEGEIIQTPNNLRSRMDRPKELQENLVGDGRDQRPPQRDGVPPPPEMAKNNLQKENGEFHTDAPGDQNLYIIGGAILILLVVIGILLKKKTKYSI